MKPSRFTKTCIRLLVVVLVVALIVAPIIGILATVPIWVTYLLIGWVVVVVIIGLVIGRGIRIADRRDRDRYTGHIPDYPPSPDEEDPPPRGSGTDNK